MKKETSAKKDQYYTFCIPGSTTLLWHFALQRPPGWLSCAEPHSRQSGSREESISAALQQCLYDAASRYCISTCSLRLKLLRKCLFLLKPISHVLPVPWALAKISLVSKSILTASHQPCLLVRAELWQLGTLKVIESRLKYTKSPLLLTFFNRKTVLSQSAYFSPSKPWLGSSLVKRAVMRHSSVQSVRRWQHTIILAPYMAMQRPKQRQKFSWGYSSFSSLRLETMGTSQKQGFLFKM